MMKGMICHEVVPHAGTWIEIYALYLPNSCFLVVPHAGTWIEMEGMDPVMHL